MTDKCSSALIGTNMLIRNARERCWAELMTEQMTDDRV